MEYLTAEEALTELLKRYDRNPKGWSFLVSKGSSFWDILLIGPEESWQIKVDTIFKPKPLGVGVKLEGKLSPPLLKGALKSFPYGFRPLPPATLESLARKVEVGGLRPEDAAKELVDRLQRTKPVPRAKIPPRALTAVGPHLLLPKALPFSGKQKELDMKLEAELRRLLRRKYQFYEF